MGQQGHCGTCPAPTRTGSTWSTEDLAATTGTRQLPGNREEDPREEPATLWPPREVPACPAPAHPLPPAPPLTGSPGTPALLGQSHWASEVARGPGHCWGRGTTWGGQCPLRNTSCPVRLHHAYLWLRGSPKDSGLFTPSVVWGCWWALGAGTEVAGSLVALWGDPWGYCH